MSVIGRSWIEKTPDQFFRLGKASVRRCTISENTYLTAIFPQFRAPQMRSGQVN